MSEGRGRLVFAALAAAGLLAAAAAVALSGSSEEKRFAEDECLDAWNESSLALADGVHAYEVHGYRATLLTRVDSGGALVQSRSTARTGRQRCAVVFASSQVDSEPDFGVRVLDSGRWAGLALTDQLALDRIETMQRDAIETANANLLPDGRLTPR